jgi:hypothetical protein
LYAQLKLIACPHCKQVGNLIKHGFLRGYDQQHQLDRAVRATRVYCSNRFRASGCGRTFSVWLADRVKRLYLNADQLWQFLSGAAQSGNKLQAFRSLNSGLSDSATYHIWRRFLKAQAAIRTALSSLCEPPNIKAECPAQHTVAHLHETFKEHPLSPVAAYAVTQQNFLM